MLVVVQSGVVVFVVGVFAPVRLLSVSYSSVLFGVLPVLPAIVNVCTLEFVVYVLAVTRPSPSVVCVGRLAVSKIVVTCFALGSVTTLVPDPF